MQPLTAPDNPQHPAHTVIGTASTIQRKFTFSIEQNCVTQRPNPHVIASDVISLEGWARVNFDAFVELQYHSGTKPDRTKCSDASDYPQGIDVIHLTGTVDAGPIPEVVAGAPVRGCENFDEFFYSVEELYAWIDSTFTQIIAEKIYGKADKDFYRLHVQPDLERIIKRMKACFAPWEHNLELDKRTRDELYRTEMTKKSSQPKVP